jgi:pyruvate/2-oxoglutarate dehydrogenase complex dihydrolipoamide dehydrogenase (E3) component
MLAPCGAVVRLLLFGTQPCDNRTAAQVKAAERLLIVGGGPVAVELAGEVSRGQKKVRVR